MSKNKMKKTKATASPIEPEHYLMAELICQREFEKDLTLTYISL